MTKASDNLFPGIILNEAANDGSDFSNPAADYRRLFLGEDGLLHVKDSAGAVTSPYTGSGDVATDAIWDAAGDLAVGSGANTAAKLTKGSDNDVLTISASTHVPVWAAPAPTLGDSHIEMYAPVSPYTVDAGTWVIGQWTDAPAAASEPYYGVGLACTSGAQNDAISWQLYLAAGTWDAVFWVRKSSNTGIITLNQDAASQGTVDTYAAAAAQAMVTITGWTVATTGKKTMQIKMATKNGSSSGYYLGIWAATFIRTA